MTKNGIIRIAEFAITLQSMRQDLIYLQEQEDEAYNQMPDKDENSVIREIMLEDIDYLNDVVEGVEMALDNLRAILHNNK